MALTKTTLTGTVDAIKAGWTKFNDLIDDLAAVTTGLGASCIGVYDVADNMAATDVEAALAEIYTDVTDARSLADLFAKNAATTTGLTWGYKAGSIRVDNTVTAVVADTIALTNTATNYIEVNSAGTVSRNTTGFTSGRVPLYTAVCAGGAIGTITDKRAWFQPLAVPVANGTVLIGNATGDPTRNTLTATANETSITNGAGTITIGIADSVTIPTSLLVPYDGLKIMDTNATHYLVIKMGSNLSGHKELTIATGDSSRTITLGRDLDTENTVVGTTITIPNTGLHLLDTDASHDLIIKPGSDLSADKTLTITTGDADLTIDIPSLTGFTAGDMLYATSATTLSKLAKSTDGKIIRQASDIPSWADPAVSGTAVASTSGTAINYTSIPSWVKRITIMFAGVSTNGTSIIMVQIGDAGGIEATNYVGAVNEPGTATTNLSTGFYISNNTADGSIWHGQMVLSLLDSTTNTWTASGVFGKSDSAAVRTMGGSKALSATLDRVTITTANGTDAFDLGLVNILYE